MIIIHLRFRTKAFSGDGPSTRMQRRSGLREIVEQRDTSEKAVRKRAHGRSTVGYSHRSGAALTLRQMLMQEGFVYGRGRAPDRFSTTMTLNITRKFLSPFRRRR